MDKLTDPRARRGRAEVSVRPRRLSSLAALAAVTLAACLAAAAEPPPFDEEALLREHRAAAEEAAQTQVPTQGSRQGLIEVQRVRFREPIAQVLEIVTVPGEPRAYLFTRHLDLLVYDSLTGERLRAYSFAPEFGAIYANDLDFVQVGTARRLLLSGGRLFQVLDAADPASPAFLFDLPACKPFSAVLEGSRIAVVGDGSSYDCAEGRTRILEVLDGTVLYEFPSYVRPSGAWLGGSPEAPLLALKAHFPGLDLGLWTYDLSDPRSPRGLHGFSEVARAALDRRARVLAVRHYVSSGKPPLALYDPRTGEMFSSLEGFGEPWSFALAEGDDWLDLLVAVPGKILVYDLRDPREPRLQSTIEAETFWQPCCAQGPVVPLRERPWVVVGTVQPPAVVVADLRTGTILSRWADDPQGPPDVIAVTEEEPEAPRALVVSWHRAGNELIVPGGGEAHLDIVSFADLSAPRRLARDNRPSPLHLEAWAPLDGRYVVAFDGPTNVLVVADLATGETIARTGLSFVPGGHESSVAAASRTVVALDWGGVEIFELDPERGALEARHRIDRRYADSAVVTRSGAVFVLFADTLVSVTPAGEEHVLPLGFSGLELKLHPSEQLLLVGPWRRSAFSQVHFGVVDISDPAAPQLLWVSEERAMTADFARGGDVVVATFGGGSFYPQLFDTYDGHPLGGPGPSVWKWFYHGSGVAFGEGDAARMTYWHWTYSQWKTVLFDVSGDVPELLMHSDEYPADPRFAPRADQSGWYELRDDYRSLVYEVQLGDAEGVYEPYGKVEGIELIPIRWGFLGARVRPVWSYRREIAIVRDPELNRPPVAVAGLERSVECAGPAGTPFTLDGSSSSDPDSTPGTKDDIEAYRWTLDGEAVGFEPVVVARAGLGSHVARLTVTDVLGAEGSDEARIAVVDTQAPEVSLELVPEVSEAGFTGRWIVAGGAADVCEGALGAPEEVLLLAEEVRRAPVDVLVGGSEEVRVVRTRKGALRVELRGPDPAAMEALWGEARERGGLRVVDGRPMPMVLGTEPPRLRGGAVLLAAYRLADDGSLRAAEAWGERADHVILGAARDSSGNRGEATVSLKETIAELCAETPAPTRCPLGEP